MSTVYTHKMKEKLFDRISNVKSKKDYVRIYEIIYEKNKNITENQNGMFVMFDSLDNDVYIKIDEFLSTIEARKKKKKTNTNSDNNTQFRQISADSDSNISRYGYHNKDSGAKLENRLKYSNTEKNIIKRNMYGRNIRNEDSNVIYKEFDVNIATTESEASLSPSNEFNSVADTEQTSSS